MFCSEMIIIFAKRFSQTEELPYFDICAVNIPYQISSPLTFKLLKHQPAFRCAIIIPVTSSIVVLLSTPNSCFCPPPKVDSFVVRIEPRKPALQVNQKEWDGFLRICFNRKNKTLGSIFRQKSVINLLEKNYKTLQALNHATAQEKDTNDVMEFMDEDMGTDGVNAEGEISEFKKKVLDVLKKSGFEGERSSKLKLQQFLRPTFRKGYAFKAPLINVERFKEYVSEQKEF
ncbi:unnamed protein product [Malus baccata var. baccata]